MLEPDKERYMLTAEQYNELYCRAFARLDDIARQAAQAMRELEELLAEKKFGKISKYK